MGVEGGVQIWEHILHAPCRGLDVCNHRRRRRHRQRLEVFAECAQNDAKCKCNLSVTFVVEGLSGQIVQVHVDE